MFSADSKTKNLKYSKIRSYHHDVQIFLLSLLDSIVIIVKIKYKNIYFFFQGTNVDEAKVMIGSSGMKILPVDNLEEAARLAVKLSNIVGIASDADLNINFQLPI